MTFNSIIPALHINKKTGGSKQHKNNIFNILKTVYSRGACRH